MKFCHVIHHLCNPATPPVALLARKSRKMKRSERRKFAKQSSLKLERNADFQLCAVNAIIPLDVHVRAENVRVEAMKLHDSVGSSAAESFRTSMARSSLHNHKDFTSRFSFL
jgi:hypothetical protein